MEIASSVLMYGVGDHVYPKGGVLSRWQYNLQLHYTYRGSVSIRVDQEEWTQHAGEICLLLPGHREHFQYSKDVQTHHGFCTAGGAVLTPEQRRLYEGVPRTVATGPRIRMLTDLAKDLLKEKTESARNLYNHAARMIFAEFFYAAGTARGQNPAYPDIVRRAQDFMETHYAENLTMDKVARFCSVSQVHLIRLFKQQLNITPARYLWRIRLRQAAEKLVDTRRTAAEIAFQCGFASPDHFSRLFKQHYDLPPLGYRKMKNTAQGNRGGEAPIRPRPAPSASRRHDRGN